MAVNVDDKIKKLSPAQRKKVEARAQADAGPHGEGSGHHPGQRLAARKRSDLLLSRLRKSVQALGGK
jgi:hypothetical protein